MMNVLALGLVLTSLVTAPFFTPSPEKQHNPKNDDVIVKEGHRVVVVEYDKDDHGNTKVLISPQEQHHKIDEKGLLTETKDRLYEKIDHAEDKIKDASSSVAEDEETRKRFSPTELVCDAYGKCKHRIASAMGKTKDAVAGKAEETEEGAKEAVGKVNDGVSDAVRKASDKAHEAKESVKGAASDVASEARDKVAEKIEEAKGTVSDKTKQAGEMTKVPLDKVRREGKKELSEILRHACEVAVDAFDYAVPREKVAAITGILHLMGFAAAYGMCVWVTFASSYVLAGALPRQQFGMVQSKIYPVYFKAMALTVGLALLGHLVSGGRFSFRPIISPGMFQGFNLMASLSMVLVNLLYLEPRATKVMLERMKKEKEEGMVKEGLATNKATAETTGRSGAAATTTTATPTATRGVTQEEAEEIDTKSQINRLSETLQRLNSYSSLLNVLTLASLTWHLVNLGQRLHTLC